MRSRRYSQAVGLMADRQNYFFFFKIVDVKRRRRRKKKDKFPSSQNICLLSYTHQSEGK